MVISNINHLPCLISRYLTYANNELRPNDLDDIVQGNIARSQHFLTLLGRKFIGRAISATLEILVRSVKGGSSCLGSSPAGGFHEGERTIVVHKKMVKEVVGIGPLGLHPPPQPLPAHLAREEHQPR